MSYDFCRKCQHSHPGWSSRDCKIAARARELDGAGWEPVLTSPPQFGLSPETIRQQSANGVVIRTTPKGVAKVLHALKLPHQIASTRPGGGLQCWTKPECHRQLAIIQAAAFLCLGARPRYDLVDFARRAKRHPHLLQTFDAAKRLGATERELRDILEPLRE